MIERDNAFRIEAGAVKATPRLQRRWRSEGVELAEVSGSSSCEQDHKGGYPGCGSGKAQQPVAGRSAGRDIPMKRDAQDDCRTGYSRKACGFALAADATVRADMNKRGSATDIQKVDKWYNDIVIKAVSQALLDLQ